MAPPPWRVVRPAQVCDLPRLVLVVRAAYRGPRGWTSEEHLVDGSRADEDELAEAVADPSCQLLVAETPVGLVGCGCLERASEAAWLGMLAVDPAARSEGHGTTIME